MLVLAFFVEVDYIVFAVADKNDGEFSNAEFSNASSPARLGEHTRGF